MKENRTCDNELGENLMKAMVFIVNKAIMFFSYLRYISSTNGCYFFI